MKKKQAWVIYICNSGYLVTKNCRLNELSSRIGTSLDETVPAHAFSNPTDLCNWLKKELDAENNKPA